MENIKEVFLEEAEEILQNLEKDIIKLEESGDSDVINRIFRYAHTLKGSSGMIGYENISIFTHKLENLMDSLRKGIIKSEKGLIDILLRSMDWIRFSIFGTGKTEDLEKSRDFILKDIENYMSKPAEEENEAIMHEVSHPDMIINTEYKFFRIKAEFRETIFENGIDPLSLIEEISGMGRLILNRTDHRRLPDFSALDPEKCYISWDIVIRTEVSMTKISDIFIFAKTGNRISIEDVTNEHECNPEKPAGMIGEMMVENQIITEEQLSEVLDTQKNNNKKLAEIVLEKGYATKEEVNRTLKEQEEARKKSEESAVRVASGKLDNLINLLGEIIICQSAVVRAADEIEGDKGRNVRNAVHELDSATRELQRNVMAVRMTPVGHLFEQFRRFVRDSANELGKEIKIIIEGGETELDKTVIDRIGDPLKHMIRNSIDHGIESPEERRKSGKDTCGTICIRAYHKEGNIIIEVSDDGRGIDREKIRKKAENMMLLNNSDHINDEILLSYIFLPGFSTAEKAGKFSGRGVGMDVVKTNIDALRGSIRIESIEGKGTIFKIKLPLTLAIIDGMIVRVGRYKYIIPLLSIVESIKPDRESLHNAAAGGELICIRGQYSPLVKISSLFNIKADSNNPYECITVIVESDGISAGLVVDELIGQQQIVIKNIDKDITTSGAISGASILGDGTVALIIDVQKIVRRHAA